jgi:DNA polymerase III delta subunit
MADDIVKITVVAGGNQFEMRNAKAAFVEKSEKLYPNHSCVYFDDGKEISFAEFAQEIIAVSMFGEAKFLFINHAESKNTLLLKSNFEIFEKNMQLCADNIFIFIELDEDSDEKAAKNCFSIDELSEKLKQTTQKFGGSFSRYETIKEYEIPKWITKKAYELFNREISEQNAESLVKYCGADLGILDGELRKIDSALPAKKEISLDDIKELAGDNRQISAQEAVTFIGLRKWDKEALAAFESYAEKNSGFAVAFLSELFRKFWTLLKIRLYCEENSAKANSYFKSYDRETKNQIAFEIGVAAGILSPSQRKAVFPILIKPQLIEQAKNYTKPQFYEIIETITRYDREIKNGEIKPDFQKEAIKDLCREIVRTGK